MRTNFEIKNGSLIEDVYGDTTVVVYNSPNDDEKQQIFETLGHDLHDLESALDPDEISRLEFGPDDAFIIWKRPNNVSFEQELKFEESSIGLFLQKNRLTFITGEVNRPFFAKDLSKVRTVNEVVLKFFLETVRHHLSHLRAIKQLTAELQVKLNTSMENRYFLQMFALSESLIYYLNAIEANSAVLAKLRANTDKVGFSKGDIDVLDDIIIEHQQCARQTQIYSSVLSGLMDARGTIINNNMNVLLKNLTMINVVFLPLNLIASIGGMSEFTAITSGINWRISYSVFATAMLILGWITWVFLARQISRQRSSGFQTDNTGRLVRKAREIKS